MTAPSTANPRLFPFVLPHRHPGQAWGLPSKPSGARGKRANAAMPTMCWRWWKACATGSTSPATAKWPMAMTATPARHSPPPVGGGLPTVLVTGGVHGYETSGVLGALRFVDAHGERCAGRVNWLVAPASAPGGWERIQRWNHDAIDPNRSFRPGTTVQESAALMAWLRPARAVRCAHRPARNHRHRRIRIPPALAARDGKAFQPGTIPDGFTWWTRHRKPATRLPASRAAGRGRRHPPTSPWQMNASRSSARPCWRPASLPTPCRPWPVRQRDRRALHHHHRGLSRQRPHHTRGTHRRAGGCRLRGDGICAAVVLNQKRL